MPVDNDVFKDETFVPDETRLIKELMAIEFVDFDMPEWPKPPPEPVLLPTEIPGEEDVEFPLF